MFTKNAFFKPVKGQALTFFSKEIYKPLFVASDIGRSENASRPSGESFHKFSSVLVGSTQKLRYGSWTWSTHK